ncbi:MAG: hypothetical protein ACOYYU_04995 [Chloroflexota bacterium]
MTTAYPAQHRKSNYRKVFEAALRLNANEQRKLREELAKLTEVRLVPPAGSEKAIRDGQRLAAEIRAELAKIETASSLDETMRQLRGRSWLS